MRRLKAMLAICDQDALRLLRANLRAGGYEVTTVHSGQEILGHTEEAAADLLVVSETLPDTDGLTLCRRLRENSNIPIHNDGEHGGQRRGGSRLKCGSR